MKKYKDLKIKCNTQEDSQVILMNISDRCKGIEYNVVFRDDTNMYVGVKIASLSKVNIILYADESSVQVINIIPDKDSPCTHLTKEEYNRILTQFHSDIIIPLFENKYEIDFSPEDVELKSLIPGSFQALLQWVNCPGAPNAPFSHPNDLNRWFNFICTLHDSGEFLGSGDLEQWLREDNKWPDEVVTDTIIRYETEISLLDYYDSH